MNSRLQKHLANKGFLVIRLKDNLDIENISSEHKEDLINHMLVSFLSLGFKLEKSSIELLKGLDLKNLKKFYLNTFDLLKNIKGAHVKHKIFYSDFPNMRSYKDYDYFINALLHYSTASTDDYGYMPSKKNNAIKYYFDQNTKFTEVKILQYEEAIKYLTTYFITLLEGTKVISYENLELLKTFINDYPGKVKPSIIPFKCNMASFIGIYIERMKKKKLGEVLENLDLSFIKTSTDVLRLYAVISKQNVELQDKVKFISLDRKARKIILKMLNDISLTNKFIIDDLVSHEFLWKRAFEYLHIGEYKTLYPEIYDAANKLRSGEYQTYNSELTKYLEEGNIKALNLLMIKPGIFARKLDYILRTKKFSHIEILENFKKCSSNISTNVLLSLLQHFKNRSNTSLTRTVMYHKPHAFVCLDLADEREEIPCNILEDVISTLEEILQDKFSSYPKFDNVYLDESMNNYMIPINNKNSSSGFHTLSFGSKIKLNSDKNILRFFTHWKNNHSRIDIDISAELFNSDFEYINSLAWHNMGGGKGIDAYHSGDIVTAPNGASEFIDINLAKAKKKKIKYIVIANSVYTNDNFKEVPECFTGVMFKDKINKDEQVFNAQDVEIKIDLTQDKTNECLAFLVDIENMELIWLDIPSYEENYFVVAANDYSYISAVIKKATSYNISIYDLVKLHEKHITFTDNKDEALLIIDNSDKSLINPYNLELISKDWL